MFVEKKLRLAVFSGGLNLKNLLTPPEFWRLTSQKILTRHPVGFDFGT